MSTCRTIEHAVTSARTMVRCFACPTWDSLEQMVLPIHEIFDSRCRLRRPRRRLRADSQVPGRFVVSEDRPFSP